jgi:glutathione peroxidase
MIKKLLLIVFMLLVAFSGYVIIVNRNSENMNIRQKILKAVYPVLMQVNKLMGNQKSKNSDAHIIPSIPFHSLQAVDNKGEDFSFESLRGKKVLLVNTASACGYTKQYDDLQELSERFKDKLVVIGFPANDFKQQEQASDEEIAEFCRLNFGVTFPLMKKSSVIRGADQNTVFHWLSDSTLNGWNHKQPSWNFCKYLVNEKGVLTNFFNTSVPPLSDEVIAAIKN